MELTQNLSVKFAIDGVINGGTLEEFFKTSVLEANRLISNFNFLFLGAHNAQNRCEI